MVAIHALWALQLVVSTALLAKILTTMEKKEDGRFSECDGHDELGSEYQCSHLIGGVVSFLVYSK